jgi:hypothetical protein
VPFKLIIRNNNNSTLWKLWKWMMKSYMSLMKSERIRKN